MIDKVEDKNPECKSGFTPLFVAAFIGNLNICQYIMKFVENKTIVIIVLYNAISKER